MRAVVINEYGDVDVLTIAEVPTPEPGAGQVRLVVTASAVNPIDLAIRAGYLAAAIDGHFPVGFGWEVVGTVEALGEGVTGLTVGQRVMALEDSFIAPAKAQASHVLVAASSVAAAPESLTDAQAVTLPLNAATADQALDLLALPAGASLLVTGAAGSVGGFAVALGTRRGLQVTALAGPGDEAWVRAAGAVGFIARGAELPPAAFDGVLDAASLVAPALAAVRDGGAFLAVTDSTTPPTERGVRIEKVSVHGDGPRLAELAELALAGTLELRVAATVPLEQVAEAHQLLAAGGVRGQVVLLA
ncbi:NADP-dependent oxidoreductase [Jatrophihabitans sp.]|uniref:NADP-dependent oxidoreductase n=1 Tax=Jatrophihabitans sp. TaxID=1932789 RepID=UPI0030C710E8|nr:NADPH:quinone reductase and related Zn-dependentoxidoreductase [Jatrophihabitans sp.]